MPYIAGHCRWVFYSTRIYLWGRKYQLMKTHGRDLQRWLALAQGVAPSDNTVRSYRKSNSKQEHRVQHWVATDPPVADVLFRFSFSYKAVSYNASGRNISYRTGPYKVGSGYEPETKTRKGAGYEEAPRSEDGRRSYPSKYDYV